MDVQPDWEDFRSLFIIDMLKSNRKSGEVRVHLYGDETSSYYAFCQTEEQYDRLKEAGEGAKVELTLTPGDWNGVTNWHVDTIHTEKEEARPMAEEEDWERLDTPGSTAAEEILHEVAAIIQNKRGHHGDAVENTENIAKWWTLFLHSLGLLDEDEYIEGWQAAYMMVLLKVSRASIGEHKLDDDMDIAGYAAISGACSKCE